MKKIALIFLLVSSYISYAQNKDMTCLDFSKGEFRNINNTNASLNSTIIRKGEKQLEITDQGYTFKKIYWLNDCDYSLFFNKKESKKDAFKKYINRSGGIFVKMEKIEDGVLYYRTSYSDGKREIVGSGRLIKISNDFSFR